MTGGVAGRRFVVTGAAQGIGFAIAERLAREGATVALTDIAAAGDAAARSIGNGARFFELDVTSPDAWRRVVESVVGEFGQIDGLVSNAGVFLPGLIDEMADEDFRRVMEVDLFGAWHAVRAVVPAMKRAGGGSIVIVSSVAGLIGMAGCAAYSAAKWGVRGLARTAAKELGPFGIRVNTLLPGNTDTPLLRAGMPAGVSVADAFPEISLGRAADAAEIAAAALFLLSDEASYVSGAELTVDGGWTAGTGTAAQTGRQTRAT